MKENFLLVSTAVIPKILARKILESHRGSFRCMLEPYAKIWFLNFQQRVKIGMVPGNRSGKLKTAW